MGSYENFARVYDELWTTCPMKSGQIYFGNL